MLLDEREGNRVDIILESKYKIISKDNKLKINFVKKI